MPPEQALGLVAMVDTRSDVFSLGAILCEILTGAPPYLGEEYRTVGEAAMGVLGDAYARLDAAVADPELVNLARECLSPTPEQRPADAGIVARRIEGHLSAVQERAQQAKLEAAAAQARAEEERRARAAPSVAAPGPGRPATAAPQSARRSSSRSGATTRAFVPRDRCIRRALQVGGGRRPPREPRAVVLSVDTRVLCGASARQDPLESHCPVPERRIPSPPRTRRVGKAPARQSRTRS